MKKLMLIGATIVVGLIAYVSLYSYVDTNAGTGKSWKLQGNPDVQGMNGDYLENSRVITPSGEVLSISFTCNYNPQQLCWIIINGGKTFRSFGINEVSGDPNYVGSGSGTVESTTNP